MKITRSRATSTLFGCILAVASTACNNDKTSTDAGLIDSGTDSGVDSGTDSGTDAGTDGGAGAVAFIRLANLALGFGTPVPANPPTIPAPTTGVHVCVKRALKSNGNVAQYILFSATSTVSGTTYTWTASPLLYGAISKADNSVPTALINSNAVYDVTAEVWAAADIDTTATAVGTAQLAVCKPNAAATPITSYPIPAGDFADGKHYTVVITGHNNTSTPPLSDCLDATASAPATCPDAAIHKLDDTVTPAATGTTVRIVNASTTFAQQGSCQAPVTGAPNPGATPEVLASTGQSTPVLAGASATVPRAVDRPTAASNDNAFATDFVALTGNLNPAPYPALFFGPILPTAGGPICPTSLRSTPTQPVDIANPPNLPSAALGQSYANGSLEQNARILANYNPATNPSAATAVTGTSTADGSVVTIFIIDQPNPAAGQPQQPNFVPAQVLIQY